MADHVVIRWKIKHTVFLITILCFMDFVLDKRLVGTYKVFKDACIPPPCNFMEHCAKNSEGRVCYFKDICATCYLNCFQNTDFQPDDAYVIVYDKYINWCDLAWKHTTLHPDYTPPPTPSTKRPKKRTFPTGSPDFNSRPTKKGNTRSTKRTTKKKAWTDEDYYSDGTNTNFITPIPSPTNQTTKGDESVDNESGDDGSGDDGSGDKGSSDDGSGIDGSGDDGSGDDGSGDDGSGDDGSGDDRSGDDGSGGDGSGDDGSGDDGSSDDGSGDDGSGDDGSGDGESGDDGSRNDGSSADESKDRPGDDGSDGRRKGIGRRKGRRKRK